MLMPGDNILNAGGSYGLQYPLIVGDVCGEHVIWCRHCGIVFASAADADAAGKVCRALNGLDERVDPEVLAAIDATP